jgi:hypothetical protein
MRSPRRSPELLRPVLRLRMQMHRLRLSAASHEQSLRLRGEEYGGWRAQV